MRCSRRRWGYRKSIMIENEFEQLLSFNHELLSVEFKGPGLASDRDFFAKILKASIRMSNMRGGGTIIIGVDEDKANHKFVPTGLSEVQITSWSFDNIIDQFAKYTEPVINFKLEIFDFKGKNFIILHIQEFEHIPVICKADYGTTGGKNIINEGAILLKSQGKPESKDKLSYVEMRNLLDLAIEKGVQRFVSQANGAGLIMLNKDQKFSEQLKDFEGPVLDKIRKRGYWNVIIRPSNFSQYLIPNVSDLSQIIGKATVTFSYDEFPIMGFKPSPPGQDWIKVDVEDLATLAQWQFFQSGLFISTFGITEDWFEYSLSEQHKTIKPGTILLIERVLLRAKQIFSFAANLALNETYNRGSDIHVEINLTKLTERSLISFGKFNPAFYLHMAKPVSDQYTWSKDIARSDLISSPMDFALDLAENIFIRFNVEFSRHIIKVFLNNI